MFLNRIGIRSEDLQDLFKKSVKGSGLALSSPRLVIPAAIYGLWELSQQFTHDLFDFQVTDRAISCVYLVSYREFFFLLALLTLYTGVVFCIQLLPAMLGIFAYKAAALVQVYRDNEDLQFIFPENEERQGS